MFKKTELQDKHYDNEGIATDTQRPRQEPKVEQETGMSDSLSARSVSYIGPGVHFTGVIAASEGLVIEGSFEGTLTQEGRSLTVGRQGRVSGEIEAGEIDIRGKVDGDIYATERVRLHSGCEVTGAIYCKKISTEEGALFNGTIDMSLEEIKLESAKIELATSSGETVAKKPA